MREADTERGRWREGHYTNLGKAWTRSEQLQPLPPGPVAVYVDLSRPCLRRVHLLLGVALLV